MNSELLRKWLGISPESWPPDHYTLLGLSRGETDPVRIERQVQDRMAALRCYQLSHPDEATEGMNRVAQAFVCLTQTGTRSAYDLCLPDAPPGPSPTRSIDDTVVGNRTTKLDWRAAPPPVRRSDSAGAAPRTPPPVAEAPVAEPIQAPPPAAPLSGAPTVPDVDVELRRLVQRSPEAIAGLGTLEAIIDRIDRTRALLVAWERLGCFVKSPKRPLKPKEEEELTRRWKAIQEATVAFPPILAQPGKPGYRVAALGRLDAVAVLFRTMDEEQRRLLAADWLHGHMALRLHRSHVREQFKHARAHSAVGLGVRAVRFLLNDHPVPTAIVALALLALVAWVRWK